MARKNHRVTSGTLQAITILPPAPPAWSPVVCAGLMHLPERLRAGLDTVQRWRICHFLWEFAPLVNCPLWEKSVPHCPLERVWLQRPATGPHPAVLHWIKEPCIPGVSSLCGYGSASRHRESTHRQIRLQRAQLTIQGWSGL